MLIKHTSIEEMNRYPSDCVRLSFEGPKDWTICFLLNVVDLGFHIAMHPRYWSRTYNCWSSISRSAACSLKSILMWRRKVIICSCSSFRLKGFIRQARFWDVAAKYSQKLQKESNKPFHWVYNVSPIVKTCTWFGFWCINNNVITLFTLEQDNPLMQVLKACH